MSATRRAILEQHRCRLGGRIGIHEMPEHSALEIDEPEDWARVEAVLRQLQCADLGTGYRIPCADPLAPG